MVDLVPLSKGQFIRLPWLPQRGELSAKLTERGNGKACADSIIPLSGPTIGNQKRGSRGWRTGWNRKKRLVEVELASRYPKGQ